MKTEVGGQKSEVKIRIQAFMYKVPNLLPCVLCLLISDVRLLISDL